MKKQILKPRKTGEQRRRNHKISIEKKIKRYIKDGSKGNLNLSGTPVEKLPDNLKVGGNLYLINTPIKKLSDNLKVGSGLYLNNTSIKELPDNLQVGGGLGLSGTPVEKLPDNLKVGGNLNLINTPLSKKYSKEEIESMIEEKGGYVKRNIIL